MDMKPTISNFQRSKSLIPTVIQDERSKDILMLGYMNQNAFAKTRETGFVYFWSRKRKKLWKKGETSGNMLKVKEIYIDCDNDALLIKIERMGKNVCHLGTKSCFMNKL